MKNFKLSIFVTVLCLIAAYLWAGMTALVTVGILAVMEVSLSFDNAVVNASVLKNMDAKWRRLFLTLGILIAVFGMRLIFPIAIVSVATGATLLSVGNLAISDPSEYSNQLSMHHTEISAFGGMFLLLVFFGFLFDEEKETHWLGGLEKNLGTFSRIEMAPVLFALLALLVTCLSVSPEQRYMTLLGGLVGVLLYMAVNGIGEILGDSDTEHDGLPASSLARNGISGFLYLEVLDASFSFDGVIGAFAISNDIFIIMLGLAIGAMFVRSLTIFLVEAGTLDEYIFLEHGAHWAIGFLALIMLISIAMPIPELISGLTGFAFIMFSFISSIRHKTQSN